jgi:Flp pilus assembly protein TadG
MAHGSSRHSGFVRQRASSRRGATAVEFALTAPILFVLVLGAIEFSRANMLVHTAAIAATEAARRSIIPGATAAECQTTGMAELQAVGVTDANFSLDPPEILENTKQVTVNLSVPLSMRNGYLLPRIFLGKEVFNSVTLQREGKSEEAAGELVGLDGVRPSSAKDKPKKDKSGKGNSDDDDD